MPILVLGDDKYEFDAAEFTAKEAIAIEKATGYDWQDFLTNAASTPLGKLALAWMVLRHNGQPTLDFNDVDFPMGDFDIEPDAEQLAAIEKARLEAEANPPEAAGRGQSPAAGRRRSAGSKSSTGSTPPATST